MNAISTTAVYENGVLRPLEKLNLPERQKLRVLILSIQEAQGHQATLAEVLGFDPADEEKMNALAESQYQAAMLLAGTARSGHSDTAENHDKYLYEDPHQ
jgi:predicted DNA-binding antitoxin AbrB/MazE fold protein